MAVSVLGTGSDYGSSNSIAFNYTCHSGSNRKLLVAIAIRATSPEILAVGYNSIALTFEFSTTVGDLLTYFYRLDDASFPGTPGSYILASSTRGTDPKVAMAVIEVSNAEQGSIVGDVGSSSDGSPIDVSLYPETFGSLVFCWSCRAGASTISTTMTGTETYIRDDLAFDYFTFEAAYVVHEHAGACSCIVDISSANNLLAASIVVETTEDPYPTNGLFFGLGF